MFSYSGPARLVYADGNAVELDRVDLIETVDDAGMWQLSGAGSAAEELTGGEARIKLPTGGEADVLVSNVRVSEGMNGVSSKATLLGV
ncbi:hypothetical protein ACFWNN_43285 [Lentzea sp. NPDC058450]|uniref:hypothetical protein n=1 Tax=unclassified Lentzea TaxID=2643253 RepID=UPI003648505C